MNIDNMYHPFIELVFEEVESKPNSRWITESKQEFIELLYLLIVYLEGFTAQILHLQEKTNVLIISQFGEAHEFFLADILESYFPNELDCFSKTDNHFKDSEIEILVTDTQVEEIRKNPLNEVPMIGIEYAPNERNWKMFRNVLTEIKKSKEEDSN